MERVCLIKPSVSPLRVSKAQPSINADRRASKHTRRFAHGKMHDASESMCIGGKVKAVFSWLWSTCFPQDGMFAFVPDGLSLSNVASFSSFVPVKFKLTFVSCHERVSDLTDSCCAAPRRFGSISCSSTQLHPQISEPRSNGTMYQSASCSRPDLENRR